MQGQGTSAGTVEGSARRQLCQWLLLLALIPAFSGCDQLGIETPLKARERQDADAKAIGGACRNAMRAIEDCYTLNPGADKSAVFAGWRDMDEYMRENKLEGVAPVVPRPLPPPPPQAASKPAAKASKPKAGSTDDDGDDQSSDDESDKPKKKKGHSKDS